LKTFSTNLSKQKSLFLFVVLFLIVNFGVFSTNLFAANTEVRWSIPNYQYFTNKDSNGETPEYRSVDGFQLDFRLESLGPFGIGFEEYETRFHNADFWLKTRMYNLSYQVIDSDFKLVVGLGAGTQSFQCTFCASRFNSTRPIQAYSRLGVMPGDLFEFFLQFHAISSKITAIDSDYEADLGSFLASLGLGVIF